MKTVAVAQAQANLPDLLRAVEAGEKIQVVRKRKAVAKLVPMNGAGKKVNWSDTWSRADAIIGEKPAPGKPGSRIVIEGQR
jgi:antitoxin (DNA-binding transcriptional repressor) of toxin-antitoxin stability system